MTVRAEVSKHERDGWPFDTSGRTEFWMQMAEAMIMALVYQDPVRQNYVPANPGG